MNASISDGFSSSVTIPTPITSPRSGTISLRSPPRGAATGIDPTTGGSYLYSLNSYSTTTLPTPVPPYKSAGNATSPTSLDLVASDLFPHTLIACTASCTGGNRIILTDPGSWSYRLTAGANLGSANPASVKSQVAGDVVLKGTPAILQGSPGATEILLPVYDASNPTDNALISTYLSTMVRTGTGNIGVFAAGDVKLSDLSAANTAAPGVIYAAGVQTAKLPDPGYVVSGGSVNASYMGADAFLEPELMAYDVQGVDSALRSGSGGADRVRSPHRGGLPYKAGDVHRGRATRCHRRR